MAVESVINGGFFAIDRASRLTPTGLVVSEGKMISSPSDPRRGGSGVVFNRDGIVGTEPNGDDRANEERRGIIDGLAGDNRKDDRDDWHGSPLLAADTSRTLAAHPHPPCALTGRARSR